MSDDPLATQHEGERTLAAHWLLLRLAGAIPDSTLVRCRAWLAEGDVKNLARAAGHAVISHRVPLRRHDLDLLIELYEQGGLTSAELSRLRTVDVELLPMFDFAATLEGAQADLVALTSGRLNHLGLFPSVVRDGPVDRVDDVLAAAAADEPAVTAGWRCWRYPADGAPWPPPRRVFVVEIVAEPGLAETAAMLQRMLVEAGETDPQVEVYPDGAVLPAYQDLARAAGALVYSRAPDPGVRMAALYDDVDPVGGPVISPDHATMDDPERTRVVHYLDGGEPLLVSPSTSIDVVDPGPDFPVPMGYRTDGLWIWNDAAAYYLKRHGVAPDPDLVAHVRGQGFEPSPVNGLGLHRARAALMRHVVSDPPEG